MKTLFLLGFIVVLNFTKTSFSGNNQFNKKETAKCVGANPCRACSNCSSCGWCKAGGTCGVCLKKSNDTLKTSRPSTTKPVYSGQCKAITKKGTRCSRSARSNGYCWQHGG